MRLKFLMAISTSLLRMRNTFGKPNRAPLQCFWTNMIYATGGAIFRAVEPSYDC